MRIATSPAVCSRYSLVHDVAHTNVAFMFGEELGALHTESDLARRSPTEAGLYDLGRYKNL